MSDNKKVNVAVVVGRHPYDVIEFDDSFAWIPEVRCYQQHMEQFVKSPKDVREWYDVVCFYNWHNDIPDPATEKWYESGIIPAMEALGETKQGIIMLHHALVAWLDWRLWDSITGIQNRVFTYHHNQKMHLEIVDREHPITKGLSDWDMIDEGYRMASANEGSNNHILIKTDHPNCMASIAWTRMYNNSKVFCFESGHDKKAFLNKNYQEVLRRGILWAAGRI